MGQAMMVCISCRVPESNARLVDWLIGWLANPRKNGPQISLLDTHPKFNRVFECPWKVTRPEKERIDPSNHHFSGGELSNFGGVCGCKSQTLHWLTHNWCDFCRVYLAFATSGPQNLNHETPGCFFLGSGAISFQKGIWTRCEIVATNDTLEIREIGQNESIQKMGGFFNSGVSPWRWSDFLRKCWKKSMREMNL